jgi:hypothetical protein
VRRLIFGSIDFQMDLGIRGDEQLDFHRAHLVLASPVGGIDAPVGGDEEGRTPNLCRMQIATASMAAMLHSAHSQSFMCLVASELTTQSLKASLWPR